MAEGPLSLPCPPFPTPCADQLSPSSHLVSLLVFSCLLNPHQFFLLLHVVPGHLHGFQGLHPVILETNRGVSYGRGHLGLGAAAVGRQRNHPFQAPCHLEAGQVVPDDALLPDFLGSLRRLWQLAPFLTVPARLPLRLGLQRRLPGLVLGLRRESRDVSLPAAPRGRAFPVQLWKARAPGPGQGSQLLGGGVGWCRGLQPGPPTSSVPRRSRGPPQRAPSPGVLAQAQLGPTQAKAEAEQLDPGGQASRTPTFFFSDKSFHMRARRRVSSLSESSGRSS